MGHLPLTHIIPAKERSGKGRRAAGSVGAGLEVAIEGADRLGFAADSRDYTMARQILNLDPDRRYILFGAMASTSDRRKGFHLLQPALKQLAAREGIGHNTELLIFGACAPEQPVDLGLPAHYMGHLHDDVSLAVLYAAADVFAAPSMQDNLPNTLVEAMSCGTPCVAFAVGGMSDLINSENLGILARPFEVADFCDALASMLRRPPAREMIRQTATERYTPMQAAQRYAQVYALETSAPN